MAEPAFRGTLLLLQNRTRRDPESYRDEFLAQLEHFKASSATVAAQRVANPQYIAVLNYICHVSHCYPKETRTVANIVVDLLKSSKGNALPQDLRTALVKSMMLLRAKDLITTDETFPVLFMLLQEKDKTIRRAILSHIVSDIRKVNQPGAKNGTQINKNAQNFLFSVMAEDDPTQARCAEMVMVDLYRRRVWCDERTVEVMTKACFSKHTPILRMALRFFLLQMPKISSLDDEKLDEDDDADPGRAISKMKQKLKIVKKTAYRDRVLKRNVKEAKRKYNKQEREEEEFAKQHVDPIRLLRDPQQFVERLLAKLHKTSERFETRILYLNVIARTIAEHEIVHLPLYSFLERYMEPAQLHATQLLALSSMCVHRMVPPDALEPLVRAIANHFVSDRSSPDAITVGINTIREICKRQPLAMNADLLKDLVEYKNQRGDKGVIMAARALIQLFREVYPELLPSKLRGSKGGAAGDVDKPVYGQEHVYTDIPGLDLLYKAVDNSDDDDASSQISLSSDDSDSDSDGNSGEWVTDSDSEIEGDDVDGEFANITESDGSEDDEEEDEADCPQLVPARPAAGAVRPGKQARREGPADKSGAPPAKKMAGDVESDASIVLSDGKGSANDEESGCSADDDDEEEEGEWLPVASGSDDDDDEEEEASEEEAESLSKALVAHSAGREWSEDVHGLSSGGSSAPKVSCPASETSSKESAASVGSSRILTDADFEKIRKLQAQNGSHQSLRGKLLDRDLREKHRKKLIHGVSGDLSAHDIEHFTVKKRDTDKAAKIEQARELRKASSKFEMTKKKKSKLNSTHGEHAKRGKLFQMTKRSQRVATKLRSSGKERAERAKEMKQKNIKFRIKRGWKA